ncbi:ParB/RepB/Spo0J family partition protein, partial [Thermodesulfobacteriota bacterium]
MRFEAKKVALSRIRLSDETYRITTNSTFDDLSLSIHQIGLVIPPILVRKDSEFTIVCGFRRIAACCHLEYSHVRTSVLDSNTTALECIEYAIADNALQRPLNLVEKSRSYAMLSEFYPDDSSLAAAAPSLGLNDNPSFIKKIIKLCRYP